MRKPARTARSGSSSCTTGTPKTPTTASPMNFSTVPPWDSMALVARHRSTRRARHRRPRGRRPRSCAVKETRSQNRVVTVLRSSTLEGAAASFVAHLGQNAILVGGFKAAAGAGDHLDRPACGGTPGSRRRILSTSPRLCVPILLRRVRPCAVGRTRREAAGRGSRGESRAVGAVSPPRHSPAPGDDPPPLPA